MNTPINIELVDGLIAKFGIQDFAKATIREVKQVAATAEKESGVEFIKMEMGIPGLPAAQVGVDAQIKALQDGIAHSYPDIEKIKSDLNSIKNVIVLDIEQAAKDNGVPRSANVILLGAAQKALGIEYDKLEDAIRRVFGRKGEAIVEANIKALSIGRAAQK